MKKLFSILILFSTLSINAFAADWYAQNSTVNIDSASEWNSDPAGGGTVLTWGSLGATDNLYANGKTAIAINVGFTCAKISTEAGPAPGTAGGGFITVATTPVTVSANIVVGTTHVLTPVASTGTIAWAGNISFAGSTATTYGVYLSANGNTFNLTGNATGGSATGAFAIVTTGTSIVNINGTATGGSFPGSSYGFYSSGGSGVASVLNATGGTATNAAGVNFNSNAACTITGIITNSASSSGAIGRITYTPADATKYIVYGTTKYPNPVNLTVGNVKSGIVYGDLTGTYTAIGGGGGAWGF